MRLRGRVDGLGRLGAALAGIAEGGALSPGLRETAEEIRARAAANLADGAPPDSRSGALARSLTVSPASDGGFTVGTPLDYGWHLELGSLARRPAPWLAPAAEDARPGLLARLRERLNGTLAAALRRTR
jgi:hypothetical protein